MPSGHAETTGSDSGVQEWSTILRWGLLPEKGCSVPTAVANGAVGPNDPVRIEMGDLLDDPLLGEDNHAEGVTIGQ